MPVMVKGSIAVLRPRVDLHFFTKLDEPLISIKAVAFSL